MRESGIGPAFSTSGEKETSRSRAKAVHFCPDLEGKSTLNFYKLRLTSIPEWCNHHTKSRGSGWGARVGRYPCNTFIVMNVVDSRVLAGVQAHFSITGQKSSAAVVSL